MTANKVLQEWSGIFSNYGENELINECMSYDRYEETYATPTGQIAVYLFKDGSVFYIKEDQHTFTACGALRNRKALSKMLKKEIALQRVA